MEERDVRGKLIESAPRQFAEWLARRHVQGVPETSFIGA
jgi:hypothetical protein